ncbi:MAG: anthranilate phosphoribosyltransferase, partial [Synergistaceae bacterium]|nr:anthranilate phosphoribosyltransferase [Synergistaceae bacterium]
AAVVIAAGGVKVAKHGNRAASSASGTADCLEALDVVIKQDPIKCEELLRSVGICFIFAQNYHTSMKHVGSIRKELGIRTVFNILGPLTNPASPSMMLLGVYDESLVEPLAKVMSGLGVRRGLVVYCQDRIDEITSCAPNTVCEIKEGYFKTFVIKPEDYGLTRSCKTDLKGGTPKENAKITLAILQGEKGPKRDTVLMNAGAAFYVAGKVGSIADGIKLAEEVIDSGKAMTKLNEFREASKK